MLGKIEGKRRRGGQRMRWLDGFTDTMDMGLVGLGVGDGQGGLEYFGSCGHKELYMTERLNCNDGRFITVFFFSKVSSSVLHNDLH